MTAMVTIPDRLGDGAAASIRSADIDGTRPGYAASLLLHAGIVLFMIVARPDPAPPVPLVIPVDLVRLAARTIIPATPVRSALPAMAARREPIPPAPAATPNKAIAAAASPTSAAAHFARPTTARPSATARGNPHPHHGGTHHRAAPADDLRSRLQALARLRQPGTASAVARPGPEQLAYGLAAETAAPDAAAGRDAALAARDFIRAQVERRWSIDRDAVAGKGWTVAIRTRLAVDGTVVAADIVETPRFHDDEAYRAFAYSARNAVLLSSPLVLPAGDQDLARDVTIVFDPAQVFR